MPFRLAAFAALALVACRGTDPTGTSVTPPGSTAQSPQTLRVRGHGVVDGRYTSELTTLDAVTGARYAYTATWQRRSGGVCTANNCGNVVYVWSVAGAAPVLVDSLVVQDPSVVNTTGDVQVTDDGALLVVATEPTGYLVTYSLADPAHPRLLARYTTPDLANGVHTAQISRVNGTLYAFCSIDPRRTDKARLTIVDLSDPLAPREVWSREMGNPYVHDVFVRDGYLLTALWDDGMTVWDIGARGKGSPSAPDSVGNVRTATGQIHNVWWLKDPQTGSMRWAFLGEEGPGVIGSSAEGDIHVVDMSDLAKPREVAYFSVAGAGTHNFSVDERDGILYAAYYNAGVRALDVRGDLGACADAQRGTLGRCDLSKMGRELARGLSPAPSPVYVWGVEYANGTLYASDMLGGLWVLDAASR
jgi:hypothetical protein